ADILSQPGGDRSRLLERLLDRNRLVLSAAERLSVDLNVGGIERYRRPRLAVHGGGVALGSLGALRAGGAGPAVSVSEGYGLLGNSHVRTPILRNPGSRTRWRSPSRGRSRPPKPR